MEIIPDENTPAEVIEQPLAADPAPEPAPVAVDPAPEPEPQPEPAPVAKQPPAEPPKVPVRIMQERLGEVTRKKDAEIEARDRRIAEYEAILQRMQQPKPGEPERPRAAPAPAAGEPNFEQAVQTAVTQREANRAISAMVSAGRAAFTPAEWNEKAEILGAVGAASPEFVMDVIAADPVNAHKIIFTLAQDPERAAELVNMDMRQRTAELTRMSMAEQAKTPSGEKPAPEAPKPAVSRAPAPKPAIAPRAAAVEVDPTTPDGDAKMSDAEWEKWYKNKYMKRA